MVEIAAGQHGILEGINGTGKTFYGRNGWLPLFERCAVIDTEGMEFEDFPTVSVKGLLKLLRSQYSFAVKVSFTGDLDTDLARISELALGVRKFLNKKTIPATLYFDEFTDFADANTIPSPLRSLIRTARKRNISVLAGTQRPQLMNKTMVANAVHRFYFFMSDYDSEAIKSYAPFVKENLSAIPYQSYRCLYQGPDSSVIVLEPIPPFDWSRKLKNVR